MKTYTVGNNTVCVKSVYNPQKMQVKLIISLKAQTYCTPIGEIPLSNQSTIRSSVIRCLAGRTAIPNSSPITVKDASNIASDIQNNVDCFINMAVPTNTLSFEGALQKLLSSQFNEMQFVDTLIGQNYYRLFIPEQFKKWLDDYGISIKAFKDFLILNGLLKANTGRTDHQAPAAAKDDLKSSRVIAIAL